MFFITAYILLYILYISFNIHLYDPVSPRLGGCSAQAEQSTSYNAVMEDCVLCWLRLIGQRAKLQLQRDLRHQAGEDTSAHLEDLTSDTHDLIKLVMY